MQGVMRHPLLQLKPPVARTARAPAAMPEDAVDSAALLRGQREVLIRHGGEVYRLRHTRNDKLILTK
jgi:hemin uptake protein HemP